MNNPEPEAAAASKRHGAERNINESYILRVIYDENIAKLERNELGSASSIRECIFRVPTWLRSSKPEAFTPKFMGLGPYHHSRKLEEETTSYSIYSQQNNNTEEEKPELLMTDKMKLGAAKKVKMLLPDDKGVFQQLVTKIRSVNIHDLYHPDVMSTSPSYEDLLIVLTMDGFFLLGLLLVLTSSSYLEGNYLSYFLIGEDKKPLVHKDGEELTKNLLIREVFMLENQIPTEILLHIWRFKPHNKERGTDHTHQLGSVMLELCADHCPIVNFRNPSTTVVEEHDHLLALMYRLIVPAEEEPEAEPKAEGITIDLAAKDEDNKHENVKPSRRRSTSTFRFLFNTLFFPLALCLIFVYTIPRLPKILWRGLRYLFSCLGSVLGFLEQFANPALGCIHQAMKGAEGLAPGVPLNNVTNAIAQLEQQTSAPNSSSTTDNQSAAPKPPPMIPSVTELDQVGIVFKPALGSVYSIQFDEQKCVFYLPTIKLDANSEVIIRNLMAYEMLAPKMKGPRIFTKYIELMRAIIDTVDDVKILVRSEIIHTYLSNEDVTKLFNGMTKSTRDTKIAYLEEEIRKVNMKYKIKLEQKIFRSRFMPGRMATAIGGLVFLILTALQTFCTAYQCSGVLKHRKAL